MARARKEAPKPTQQERLADRWNQHVFFLTKQFPRSSAQIRDVQRKYTPKKETFEPNEAAVMELEHLYHNLKSQMMS